MRNPEPPVDKNLIAGNIFMKYMVFEKAGDRNDGHYHTYDHFTLLTQGSVEAFYDGRREILKAPHIFLTQKQKAHQFVALEDQTVLCCIHVLKDSARDHQVISADTPLVDAIKMMDYVCTEIDHQTTLAPVDI